MTVPLSVKEDDTAKLDWTKKLITCERNVGAGKNVGGSVGLNMGKGRGDQRGHSVKPDNTALKIVI